MNNRKILFLIFIFLCGSLMVLEKTAAETTTVHVGTKYEYANIKTCYLKNQTDAISTTKMPGTGYQSCLSLSSLGTVDYDRLKAENACPDGYQLEETCVGDVGAGLFCGAQCLKEKKETKTLYCGYPGEYEKVMIVYDGNDIKLRISQKQQKENGDIDGVYVNDPLTTYVPLYDDKSWALEEDVKITFNHTDKYYSSGVLNACPTYMFTVKTGKKGNYKISEYVFSDNEEATDAEIDNWDYAKFLRRDYTVISYEEGNADDNYYATFDSSDICDVLSKNTYSRICSYNIGGGNIMMYMSNNNYHLTVDNSGFKIQTYFTLNELMTKNAQSCPNELYYWSDGNIYFIALEDTENPLYYRNKVLLSDSTSDVVIPERCIPDKEVGGTCESLLGHPEDKGSPAYYIVFVFDVMKYVAIIILIVFTIIDFSSAIPSQDNDIIKNTAQKALKRLIICIIIFILPTLISLLLGLMDKIPNDMCGIK